MSDGKSHRPRNKLYEPLDPDCPIEHRYMDAYLEEVRRHGFTSAILTEELEAEIQEIYPQVYRDYEFELEERHIEDVPTKHFVAKYKSGVKQHQARLAYDPYKWVLSDDPAGWPSAWWFRFGQEKWEDSTWRLIPALPAAMCAVMGYPLVTSCRYMGDLTDEQKAELLRLLANHSAYGHSSDADTARTKELLALTSYGMELPVLDVDTVKPPKDLPEDQVKAAKERIGRAAVDVALKMTEAWREVLGVGIRWTVTNDRGALHGRSLPLASDLRHPDLLMMLTQELTEQCVKRGVPYKLVGGRGVWSESDLAVVDLSTFQKSGGGRGGMWRTPGSKKDAHMGPGSLPQTPVSRMLHVMPWLEAVTPEALGSDWEPISDETKARVLEQCASYRARKDEADIQHGRAVRGADGKVRKVAPKPVEPDADLGTTEFGEVAAVVRELMPRGDHEGMKRHDVRLALAGWLYHNKLTEEAATATLLACGGNADDSRKVVRTTYALGRSSHRIAGLKRLCELLGDDGAKRLSVAWGIDFSSRIDRPSDVVAGDDAGEDPGEEYEPPRGDPESQRDPADEGPVDPADREPSDEPPKTQPQSVDSDGNVVTRHPKTLPQFYIEEAQGQKFSPADGVLAETKKIYIEIRNAMLGERGKLYHVDRTVGSVLAFAGLGQDLVARTMLRGEKAVEAVRMFRDASKAIGDYKQGDPLPDITTLSAIRSTVEHGQYVDLGDALARDLHRLRAPYAVRRRALVDQSWSSRDRDNMEWLLTRHTAGDKEARTKGKLKFLNDAKRCGHLSNKSICPSHDKVHSRAVVCEREVSCRHCRSSLYHWIAEWITSQWLLDTYVTFEVPVTQGPVIKQVREKIRVDVDGKPLAPGEASCEEDETAKRRLLPKAYPEEKRFRIQTAPGSKHGIKVTVKCRRGSRHKTVRRELVTELLDRIKIGFTTSHDYKEFKKALGTKLGVRAWPTPDGIRVVMPATFIEDNGTQELPDEQDTLFHLAASNLWQDRSPRVVQKDEVLSLILDARRRIGEGFDRLVFALGKHRSDTETPDLEQSERDLLDYSFLRNSAMRPVKNKRAEIDLPWFTKEQMRAFMKRLAAERRGEEYVEVAPHECPVLVDDPETGGKKPCRKTLTVLLQDPDKGIFVANSQGKHYGRDEAFRIAEEQHYLFTRTVRSPVGQFAGATERMHC